MSRPRNTAQKAAVLNAVMQAHQAFQHPNAAWIYDQVKNEIPGISLGTVYRVLAGLCQEGLIKEVPQVDGPAVYDANTHTHYHVRCTGCGELVDVTAGVLPANLAETVREASQFATVHGIRVEFLGRCQTCGHE